MLPCKDVRLSHEKLFYNFMHISGTLLYPDKEYSCDTLAKPPYLFSVVAGVSIS